MLRNVFDYAFFSKNAALAPTPTLLQPSTLQETLPYVRLTLLEQGESRGYYALIWLRADVLNQSTERGPLPLLGHCIGLTQTTVTQS